MNKGACREIGWPVCIVLNHLYVFKGTYENMCAPVHMAVDTLCVCLVPVG